MASSTNTPGICFSTFCTGWIDPLLQLNDNAKADIVALEERIGSGVRRRRCCRIISLLLLVAVGLTIYVGFVDLALFNVIEEVDLSVKLTVEVAACIPSWSRCDMASRAWGR